MSSTSAPARVESVSPRAAGTAGASLPTSSVRLEGVTKRFRVTRPWTEALRHPFRARHVEALRGVDLEIRPGEFFGLLGPNGAGKTTVFKMLATLVVPDGGRLEVHGHDVESEGAAVRRLLTPVIADERSLDWRLDARENLRLYARLYRVPSRDIPARVERLLGVVGLEGTNERLVGTFSSGMKQRLLIARALLSRPRVLLLDEPTRSLDPIGAREFRRFLRADVAEREGCTVLLATHDANEALELCDRLAILHHGRVVARGSAAELELAAGNSARRVVVPVADIESARAVLSDLGAERFETARADQPEWAELRFLLPGFLERASEAGARLTDSGVRVAEFARVPLPLADLIERLVAPRDER